MELRWHMESVDRRYMVEHQHRPTLEHIRKTDKRFERARIRDVVQANPSAVRVGVVYDRNER